MDAIKREQEDQREAMSTLLTFIDNINNNLETLSDRLENTMVLIENLDKKTEDELNELRGNVEYKKKNQHESSNKEAANGKYQLTTIRQKSY